MTNATTAANISNIPYAKAVLAAALESGRINVAGLSRVQAAAVEALAGLGALTPNNDGAFVLTEQGAAIALALPGPAAPRQAGPDRMVGAALTVRLFGR
jgi:hypothetical protein